MTKHLYQDPLPAGACTYWQRAQGRDADDHGFGAAPTDFMKPEQIERLELAREQEDDNDPPCGCCTCCVDSRVFDDSNPGPWDGGNDQGLQRYPG